MKTINITCEAEYALDFGVLRDFQGDLKNRSVEDIAHIKASILELGFSFPFYVWKHVEADIVVYDVIDGHGRLQALYELVDEGYIMPLVPVVFIDAVDVQDARERLIQVNTLASSFSETGLQDLIIDIPEVDISKYTIPNIDTVSLASSVDLLRNTLTVIEGMTTAQDSLPVTVEETQPKPAKVEEIVVQCSGCCKAYTHIVNHG